MILAVDPGTTTGFAFSEIREMPPVFSGGTVSYSLLEPPASNELPVYEFGCWAETFIENHPHITVVIEKFTISQRTLKSSRAGSHDAIEVTGLLRHWSRKYLGKEPEFQQPSEAMNLFTNEWLRERGWYVKKEHARDALRHLALALAKRKLITVTSYAS